MTRTTTTESTITVTTAITTATTQSMAGTTLRTYRRQQQQPRRSVLLRTLLVLLLVAVFSSSGNRYGCQSMTVDAMNPASEAAITAFHSFDYRYFVAGGTCAAFSHGITTPIDVVKTKLQADPKKFEGKGLVSATLQICRDPDEGPSALLQGLGPTVLGYGLEGAMKFGCYELAKPIFLAVLGEAHTVLAFALASFIAGSIAAVLLVPMESLRIKQVTQPAQYQDETVLSGIPGIIREDGFIILMSGVWAMLAKQVPYTFGKQVSFDLIANRLYELSDKLVSGMVVDPLFVSLLSAFFASIVACLCSQPGDMILTETYATRGGGAKPGNFVTVVQGIYQHDDPDRRSGGGVSEFFRGTKARIVHVGMIITSQLVVYDLVKQALGLPATGSH